MKAEQFSSVRGLFSFLCAVRKCTKSGLKDPSARSQKMNLAVYKTIGCLMCTCPY